MEGVSCVKKPPNLVYGVADRPPLAVSLLPGLQQLSLWAALAQPAAFRLAGQQVG